MKLGSLATLLSMVLLPAAAGAVSTVVSNPPAVVSLVPGSTLTLTFSAVPDAAGIKGFATFFDISDASSIVLDGCSSSVDPSPVCPVGGSAFNFAVLDFTPTRGTPFEIGSVDLSVPVSAALGTTLSLSGSTTITTGMFEEVALPETVLAQVVPEPGTLLLLGIGLASLGALRRR